MGEEGLKRKKEKNSRQPQKWNIGSPFVRPTYMTIGKNICIKLKVDCSSEYDAHILRLKEK